MSDIGTVMKQNLMQLRGKSAKYVTNFLKNSGDGENGTMVDGLINMVDVLKADKDQNVSQAKISYGVGGFGIGVIATSLFGSAIWFHSKYKSRKQCQEESQSVVKMLKQEVAAANEYSDIYINEDLSLEQNNRYKGESSTKS